MFYSRSCANAQGQPGQRLLPGLLCLLGLTSLLLSLPAKAENLRVFACEPEWAALTSALAPNAKVYSATTVYQDPHHIEARPSLIAKVRRADLVVCTGASLEAGWLPLLLRQANNPKVQQGQAGYFMAAMQVPRLDIPDEVDRSMGDVHAEGNSHVHLDPRRMLSIADALSLRLQEINPTKAGDYAKNHAEFSSAWQKAIGEWEQRAASLRGQTIITHHSDFRYFSDWLGMKQLAQLEPKPGLPPSLRHLADLKAKVANEQPLLAILRKPADPPRAAEFMQQATGRPAIVMPYTIGGEGAEDLFALFNISISKLLNAAQQSSNP